MNYAISVLQFTLAAVSGFVAIRWKKDVPYALLVLFVFVSDMIRRLLLLALASVPTDDFCMQWILFCVLDLLWINWFAAHYIMSLAYRDKQVLNKLSVVTLATTVGSIVMSYLYLSKWRSFGFYSPRWIWLRTTSLLFVLLGLRNMLHTILSGTRNTGVGLGLGSIVISTLQLSQWANADGFRYYQIGVLVYFSIAILIYGFSLKELYNGKWWKWRTDGP